jgi:predicted ATPase/DNA-binding CsgD family transcriptional regulator
MPAEGIHGFVPALTSFVGRARDVDRVASLVNDHRLVTVTGPGGVGKTRLVAEVARRVDGRFADGIWLVELAAVQDPGQVPAVVASALGLRESPGTPVMQSLGEAAARWQLLLVLDNCEHVAGAAAQLCGELLPTADDVRILATSRERIGVAGEVRYRLSPLTLPRGEGEDADANRSEAVALFADRAQQADPDFALDPESGPVAARLVARLDGMPLAIELAAARVESLGLAQLLTRLDNRFALLVGADRSAAPRQRSLAATVDWSYRLLSDDEQRVFRHLSVFPAPFTLDAAEAVTGDSGPGVLHLVDCSLLGPPRTSPDGRTRYLMLETLRAFGMDRLNDAEERPGADRALARYALQLAQQAAGEMQRSGGEPAAAQWLDAEDALVHQGLAWTLQHEPPAALRLALALAPWWRLRGRWVAGYTLLQRAVPPATAGDENQAAAQFWLGHLAHGTSDFTATLAHFTAARDALPADPPPPMLADVLVGMSGALRNLDRVAEAAEHARRALTLAEDISYPAGAAMALSELSYTANYADDARQALEWALQAQQIDATALPDWTARKRGVLLTAALMDAGQTASARHSCTEGLTRARDAGDLQDQADCLWLMAELDLRAGQASEAGAHLRESLEVAAQTGDRLRMIDCLNTCGHLCAETRRWAAAVTMWAACTAQSAQLGLPDLPQDAARRREPLHRARQALGPAQAPSAEVRGKVMTLATAAEFATVITLADPGPAQEPPGLAQLSSREKELVTLVARGCTDTQIAGQLYISVSTVRSHLDRIRDKSGCRRRADLTRLALQAGLV